MTTNTTATAGLIGLFGDGAQLWNPPTQRLAAPDEVLQGKTVSWVHCAMHTCYQ